MDHDHGFDHNNEPHSPDKTPLSPYAASESVKKIMDHMTDWWKNNQTTGVPFKPGVTMAPGYLQPYTPAYPNQTTFYPNQTIVGTCSLCGGPVAVPTIWGSVVPAVPTCLRCRAVKKQQSYGPTIDMQPVSGVVATNKSE